MSPSKVNGSQVRPPRVSKSIYRRRQTASAENLLRAEKVAPGTSLCVLELDGKARMRCASDWRALFKAICLFDLFKAFLFLRRAPSRFLYFHQTAKESTAKTYVCKSVFKSDFMSHLPRYLRQSSFLEGRPLVTVVTRHARLRMVPK